MTGVQTCALPIWAAPVRVASLDKVAHLITDAVPEGDMASAIGTLAAELRVAAT